MDRRRALNRAFLAAFAQVFPAASGVIACLALAGCQLALDVDGQQCASDRDCVGLFGRSWVCTEERVCIDGAESPPPADAGSGDAASPMMNRPDLPENWACLGMPPKVIAPQ